MLLQTALDVHARKAPEALQPFHAHMEQRFMQMKAFVEKEYGIKVRSEATFVRLLGSFELAANSEFHFDHPCCLLPSKYFASPQSNKLNFCSCLWTHKFR